jgi:tetratricopeptide (TPR) repeat protein
MDNAPKDKSNLVNIQDVRDKREIKELKRNLFLNSKDVSSLVNLAGIYVNNKQELGVAEDYLREALAIDPTYVPAWYNLGILYGDAGKIDIAAQYYQKAIEIDPTYADAYYNLAAIEEKTDIESALTHFRKFLEIASPEDPCRADAEKSIIGLSLMRKENRE